MAAFHIGSSTLVVVDKDDTLDAAAGKSVLGQSQIEIAAIGGPRAY